MIIVKLQGGLGNQMFQYSLGRHLAIKNNTELRMDLSSLLDRTSKNNFTFRNYDLSIFNIKEKFAEKNEIIKVVGHQRGCLYYKVINKLQNIFKIKIFKRPVILEKFYNFNADVLGLKGDLYLDGYWQTEKYFLDISDVIRREFVIKKEYNHLNSELLAKINNCNSVSIHFRRGDYITNQVVNEQYNVCSPDYYERAINLIAEKYSDLVIFVFSDDLDWCRKNFKIKWPTFFVEGNKNYEDLIMMSHCKHNVITNSSFSWWGGVVKQ